MIFNATKDMTSEDANVRIAVVLASKQRSERQVVKSGRRDTHHRNQSLFYARGSSFVGYVLDFLISATFHPIRNHTTPSGRKQIDGLTYFLYI